MSSRYQREIEDILQKSGGLGSESPAPEVRRRSLRRLVWLYVKESLSGSLLSVTPGRVMLIGFVLLLSTLLVRPFVAGVSGYLAWGGLLLFIVGYGMVLARPPKLEKRWREQPIEYYGSGRGWLGRIRRKFRRE